MCLHLALSCVSDARREAWLQPARLTLGRHGPLRVPHQHSMGSKPYHLHSPTHNTGRVSSAEMSIPVGAASTKSVRQPSGRHLGPYENVPACISHAIPPSTRKSGKQLVQRSASLCCPAASWNHTWASFSETSMPVSLLLAPQSSVPKQGA